MLEEVILLVVILVNVRKSGLDCLNYRVAILAYLLCPSVGNSQSVFSEDAFSRVFDHKVIALGESSHGGSEDYSLRKEFISNGIRNGNSFDILLESGWEGGMEVQSFRQNEQDSLRLLKLIGHYGMQSAEFFDIVWQTKNYSRINFYGVDMQTVHHNLNFLFKGLKSTSLSIDKERYSKWSGILDHDFISFSKAQFALYHDSIWNSLNEIRQFVEILDPTDSINIYSIIIPLRYVTQYFGYVSKAQSPFDDISNSYFLYRDSCMADNIRYLQNLRGNKCIIFSANSHVMKTGYGSFSSMGGLLRDYFRDEYFVIVSQYIKGAVLGIENDKLGWKFSSKYFHCLRKSLPDRLNKLMKSGNNFLVMAEDAEYQIKKTFEKRLWIQDMGTFIDGGSKQAYVKNYPNLEFDAVYLIYEVHPVTMIQASTFPNSQNFEPTY